MRLPWSVSCVRARVVYGCVGVAGLGGDMVYGCGCGGGQDENNDHTCAEYIAY